jgi:RNA polymerase sigma-70 factor (ECF subfamily)
MADTVPLQCGAVDPDWLTTLYRDHAEGLRRFVAGVLRDRHAADDVVQATFARAVQSGEKVEPEALKTWLYRVAFHEAITWKRRGSVADRATRRLGDLQRRRGPEVPDDPLVRREVVDQVSAAMKELPASQLQVLQARVYQDKTFAQIAAETGMPLGTVLTHMRRALDKLRRKLKPDE